MINDSDAGEQPLEILKQEISVFEKTQHAQVHADAGDEPSLLAMSILRLSNLAAEPEIHRGGGEQKRSEWWIPRTVKNVAGDHEKVLPRLPRVNAPVERDDNCEKDHKGQRIKQHGR